MKSIVNQHGLQLEVLPPYVRQWNGSYEMIFKKICKIVRTILFEENLDIRFWIYSISDTTLLRNRLLAQRIGLENP